MEEIKNAEEALPFTLFLLVIPHKTAWGIVKNRKGIINQVINLR
jgi:hypothetical protein